jgi:hypothetical protein
MSFFGKLIKKSDFSDSNVKNKTFYKTEQRISESYYEELSEDELMSAAGGFYTGEVDHDENKRNN